MIFSGGNITDTSLNELCHEFKYLFGEDLEKQSLNERFNEFATTEESQVVANSSNSPD